MRHDDENAGAGTQQMHYHEVNVFGVFVAPFVPLMAVAWLLSLVLFRVSSRTGLARFVWHTSLFNFAIYAIVLFVMVLAAGVI